MAASIAPALAGVPRVNLMPRSEIARRDREKLTRLWVWVVFGSAVVALLIVAAAFLFKWSADQGLAAEQARTNQLLTEIAALSDVSEALATESELTDFRTEAMATDLMWSPVVAKVLGVLPADAVLTGFDLTVGGAPQGTDPTLEEGLVGTISVDSPTPLDIVGIIRSLRDVDGVMYADGQSVSSSQIGEGRFAYLLNVRFDQTVYSGEYAAAEGEED